MIFVELRSFEREREKHLSDTDLSELQLFLVQNPRAGAVMKGSGGLRKIRWSPTNCSRGKRGSKRIIYFIAVQDMVVWLVAIYDKAERKDLRPSEIQFLKEMIDYFRR